MIDKQHGYHLVVCDICNESVLAWFDTFQDAMDAKGEAGWISEEDEDGKWVDVCPECQEEGF